MKTLEERFFSKINKIENGCWEWMTGKTKDGYGIFSFDNKDFRAHRLSYELHFGNINKGLCVCHSCDNPSCVNPEHLFLGTHKQNMEDKVNKGRTYNGNQKGINNPSSKLTEKNIIEIKKLLSSGLFQKDIAKQYNVSIMTISNIKNNKIWKHIH